MRKALVRVTEKARLVLQDCRHAIAKHTTDLAAEEFRISWVAITALLRAVGHVLVKVDAQSSPQMKMAIAQKYAEWKSAKPEPHIFWSFIEDQRNAMLKQYEHGVERWVQVGGRDIDGRDIDAWADMSDSQGGGISPNGRPVQSELRDGPFKNRNEREVALEAAEWWQAQLNDIDRFAIELGHRDRRKAVEPQTYDEAKRRVVTERIERMVQAGEWDRQAFLRAWDEADGAAHGKGYFHDFVAHYAEAEWLLDLLDRT